MGETYQRGGVEAGMIVHESHAQVTLTCVREVSGQRLGVGTGHIGPHLAEGEVALLGC